MATSMIDKLGVPKWLDATRADHNGHGGADFVRLLGQLRQPQDGFTRVTKQAMADYFGVHRHTLDDWIRRYNVANAQNNVGPNV